MARGQQVSAKSMLHEIWMAATKEDAVKPMNTFTATLGGKVPFVGKSDPAIPIGSNPS